MKSNINPSRVTVFLTLLPILAFLLTKGWTTFAIAALFDSGPVWWPARGLEIGLIPGLLCGFYGLIACVWGFRSRLGWVVAAGIWCCIAAPVILILYIQVTF